MMMMMMKTAMVMMISFTFLWLIQASCRGLLKAKKLSVQASLYFIKLSIEHSLSISLPITYTL